MSTNDEVRVDIHETSPQEHENVRINVLQENELHEKKDELVTSPTPKWIDNKHWDKKYLKTLHRAALKDDWDAARPIYELDRDYTAATITQRGDTALHIAVGAKSFKFVQQLLKIIRPEDLAIKNADGNTVFCLVAASENVELAEAMLRKNEDLPSIRGKREMFPLHIAALSGKKEMSEFLSKSYVEVLNEENDRVRFIHNLIRSGLYDLALEYLRTSPWLAIHPDESTEKTAMHILAAIPMRSSNFADQKQQGFLKRWFRGSGSEKARHSRFESSRLPKEALELLKLVWEQISKLDENVISTMLKYPWRVIDVAVEQGNIDFLTIIIRDFPNLVLKVDHDNYSIFHVAVLNRQKEIFKLINEIDPTYKKSIREYKDYKGNNILHLAGMMPPFELLNMVSGVALQLQQELFWFQKVSKIVDAKQAEARNNNGKTPRDLLNKKIATLKDKGEKWMKDTANSCMIVATLITTVVFAAAFTVPGGTKETGTPNVIERVSFTTFVISDAISLVLSSCSILTFLSILTSRYGDEDFLYVLPRKLVLGLSTLLLSIAAMMVVFCATIFIIFKDGKIWVPILVSVIASLPVILFTKQQWRLLYDVALSIFNISSLSDTYEHSIFDDDDDEEEAY